MVEAAIILGFMVAYPEYYVAYITFFVAVFLNFSTFLVAGTLFKNERNKSMNYEWSSVEIAESFVLFMAMLVFPAYMSSLSLCFNIVVAFCGISQFIRIIKYVS